MLILRTTDIVPCKIGKLTVWVSPLSWNDQTALYRYQRVEAGEVKVDETRMLFETLRASIKKVDGFKGHHYSDGTTIKLVFDNDGKLDDDSLECLIRVIGVAPMSTLSSAIISGSLGEQVNGWKVDLKKTQNSKKKN